MEQDADKSQDATPHRRQQAREEGHVARSHDLAQAAILLVAAVALLMMGEELAAYFGNLAGRQLGGEAWLQTDPADFVARFHALLEDLSSVLLPLLTLVAVVAVVLSLLQTGIIFLPEKLMPDITRIDPLKGFGRIFSLAGAVKLLFGMLKILLIGAVAYAALYGEREKIFALAGAPLPRIAVYLCELLLWTIIKIAGAMLLLALLDYLFQWWKNEQDMKMTPQEVREEIRNLQGDPQILARRKSVQRQLALHRLSKAVPKADVVVTNPTELAVAIQYDAEKMAAPIVVAKGAGVIAQRIRRLALENGIPIVEKKPLAQALFRDVDLNHPIPGPLYAAVAEVLAYVYQLKGKPLPKPPGRAA